MGLLWEERAGAPKIINETDRAAVRLGQCVLIRASPPVAAPERADRARIWIQYPPPQLRARSPERHGWAEIRASTHHKTGLFFYIHVPSSSSSSSVYLQLFFFFPVMPLSKEAPLTRSSNDFKLTSLSLFRGLCFLHLLLLLHPPFSPSLRNISGV